MKITNVSIRKVEENESLKGYATIVLDDCIAIHSIRIIEGTKGLFVAFPSQRGKNEQFYDLVHPIKQETREMITEEILKEFTK